MTTAAILVPALLAAVAIGAGRAGGPARRTHRRTVGVVPAGPPHRPADSLQWAVFLDAVASGVRSGLSLTAAVGAATSRTGVSPPGSSHPAVEGRRLRRSAADEAVVQQALQVAAELGGAVASGLHHAANLLRERHAARAEARANAAQARLSAAVLTLVPVGFAALGALTSASYRSALGGSTGVALAAAGAVLNLTGWWWMRRTIDRATR
jgi:Flp pilus assembly protein TadB